MLALKRDLAYQISERWLSRETIFLPIRIADDVCNFMSEKKKSGNRNFNNDSGRNCCLAWLRERRSGGLLSTPTADPFVAEEAAARQAGPRAVSAHVGQVCVFGGGSSLSFPPLSSVFEGVSPVLFKLWSSLVDCVAPGVSVSGHVRPLQALYVSHIERLLEAVFVAFLKCPSVTIASGEFAIKTTLGRPFWISDQPIGACTSVEWLQCWGLQPVQGPQHSWWIRSSGC